MQMIVQSGPNNLTTPLMIHESHSLSSSASVKSTVYILYAVGGLGMIIFAVGLVTVHQYRKKFKISDGMCTYINKPCNINILKPI